MWNKKCKICIFNEVDMHVYSGEFTDKLFEHEMFVVVLIMLTYIL